MSPLPCLLGAEEIGFATAPLVTLGCLMMRVCHLGTCPVGVATQTLRLRKKFRRGCRCRRPLHELCRRERDSSEITAKLGFKSIDEMVGHVDRLELRYCYWSLEGKGTGLQ